MLSGVALYYLLFDVDVRRRAMAYVRRRFPNAGFFGNANAVYRIFLNQGQHLIDHYALLSGAVHFDLCIENKDIITKVGVPVLGPSANFHGENTPFEFKDLSQELISLVDYVVGGECSVRETSTVVDCTKAPWEILRQGAVTVKM